MQEWNYLKNPFDGMTQNSHKRLFLLATDHFDRLAQAASEHSEINDLRNFGMPTFQTFRQAYQDRKTEMARYEMFTQRVQDEIRLLTNSKIRRWDIRIQLVFERSSPLYLSLLPNLRQPFQRGSQDLIINEVLALADKLLKYPDLSDLQEEVAAFGQNLRGLRTTQQGQESVIKKCAHDLEENRQALLQVMHYMWAGLVQYHYKNPTHVMQYYDLKYLKQKRKR